MIDTKVVSLNSEVPFALNGQEPLPREHLDSELPFYKEYRWCLDAVPMIREIINHLRREIERTASLNQRWHLREAATNLFLLSCAISDTADDFLLGNHVDFSRAGRIIPGGRQAGKLVNKIASASGSYGLKRIEKWRNDWESAVQQLLEWYLEVQRGEAPGPVPSPTAAKLNSLMAAKLPAKLLNRRCRIPAAFRSQDLTPFDVFRLNAKFIDAFPDRERHILVVGLRTAGSYLAPLLRAYLKSNGYENADFVTLRPKKGLASWEKSRLSRCAAQKGLAVIIDEPIGTGGTLAKAVGILRQKGIPPKSVVALFPIHPTGRDWNRSSESLVLSSISLLSLDPEEWHKYGLLEGEAVERRLREYFFDRGYTKVQLVDSRAADQFNRGFQSSSDDGFHTRLKRVYEVELRTDSGQYETRFVLAKSVGWGWFSYHAFLLARDLAPFVPPTLGLRDGILYTEWLQANATPGAAEPGREQLVEMAASYVAARVRHAGLPEDPSPVLNRENRHIGFERLTSLLCKAYGWNISRALRRARIRHELSRRPSPRPTLIDGRMRTCEWVRDAVSWRKVDFEQHGMGKHQLSVTDPAYDLADFILHWQLSQEEEGKLVARYRDESRDEGVSRRLFLYKVLAATHSMDRALTGLGSARLLHRHQEFNRLYVEARTFLTIQTMRISAARVFKPRAAMRAVRWGNPLVVLDIDGVLDKQIFGYPSTTASGIAALSLLHSHDQPVVFNTARHANQMKEYCLAYGCAGGVAEYGSYAWDATTNKEQVLVSDESRKELERLREHLRRTPGVFLNDDYRYSIQAYIYEKGVTVPVPSSLVRNLMAELKTERLRFHQTYTDTAVTAKEADKGHGLDALLQLAGFSGLHTIAVGDSEPDLPMFRVASQSFAPANISCPSLATLLRCHIVDKGYQPGLLQIARSVLHPRGDRCQQCEIDTNANENDLFFHLLQVADETRAKRLIRALLDPMAVEVVLERYRN
jgi:hydroxymethylpyrimidine pyrophosphatase-like HAD family hydrolase